MSCTIGYLVICIFYHRTLFDYKRKIKNILYFYKVYYKQQFAYNSNAFNDDDGVAADLYQANESFIWYE